MNEAKSPKMLTVCFAILAVTIPLFNLAVAEELEAVVKQKDVHPRIASQLEQLKNDAISRTMATQTDAQRMITVVLFAEPGATIDETALEAYGGEIIKKVANVWKARVPIDRIETIADHVDGVVFINLPNKAKPLTISQGVVRTGAANYHSAGHTGAGVTIGVIDSEFAKVAEAIAANELPSDVIKIDCTGERCESTTFASEPDVHGTAVAEIIHDMAPGAKLHLIKVDDPLDVAQAQDYCQANGIDIINCSMGYNNENFYDGQCWNANTVCSAEKAYDNGILWVNSAGNEAQRHYGATFTDSNDDNDHDVRIAIETTKAGEVIYVELTWDAWPTTDQDYDLYLYDSNDNEVAKSDTGQFGDQPPVEKIAQTVAAVGTYYLVIKKYKTTSNHRLAVYNNKQDISPAVAASSLCNPADAKKVMAVGAIDYNDWTKGPAEPFSSQGPTNDGRIKPEISGPDGVSSNAYGDAFYGTSAASPHVAGAAALILATNPRCSAQGLWNAITRSAVDMVLGAEVGPDNVYGYGRLSMPSDPTSPQCVVTMPGMLPLLLDD